MLHLSTAFAPGALRRAVAMLPAASCRAATVPMPTGPRVGPAAGAGAGGARSAAAFAGTTAPRWAARAAVPLLLASSRSFHSSAVARGLKTGIVGLPNVGKSTLFNALVEGSRAQAANFPFCTIEPNVGTVIVHDPRLQTLSDITGSAKLVPAAVEFVDVAGLVAGASKGEGLGNQFLANIRECDAIAHVVRCFSGDDVTHVHGGVDPRGDAGVINTELALADLAQIDRRLERLKSGKAAKGGGAAAAAGGGPRTAASLLAEAEALKKLAAAIDKGEPARAVALDDDERAAIRGLGLLTRKPATYVANVGEEDLIDRGQSNPHVLALREVAESEGCGLVLVSAQLEAELRDLSPTDAAEYLASLGVTKGGAEDVARATYRQLGLLTFFTSGEQETRAWTVRAGSAAPRAAGVIHSDFERAFIRAEVVAYDDFVDAAGFAGARERGLLRAEGKEYIIQEGDVVLFRTGA